MTLKRPKRAAVLIGVLVLVGAIAGTASAGTGAWQDIWAQIRPLLSDPGTVNNPDNPVHWTKLKGVPGTFADGVDNGIDKAGFGLKRNLYPNLEFAVDPTKIQRRVEGSCDEGQAVTSIAADGSVGCSTGGAGAIVYHGGKDVHPLEPIGNDWATIGPGALDIPAGAWSIAASVSIYGSYDIDFADCRLETWVDGGQGHVLHEQGLIVGAPDDIDGMVARVTLPLSGVFESSAPQNVAVVCRDSFSGEAEDESNLRWGSVRITATKLAELHVGHIKY